MSEILSKCCKTKIKPICDDEGTCFYQCLKCKKPTDAYIDFLDIMLNHPETTMPRIFSFEETRALLKEYQKKTLCVGVSQWREIGEKYKYWDYFEKEIKEKIKTDLLKIADNKDIFPDTFPKLESDDYDDGFRECKKRMIEIIKNYN